MTRPLTAIENVTRKLRYAEMSIADSLRQEKPMFSDPYNLSKASHLYTDHAFTYHKNIWRKIEAWQVPNICCLSVINRSMNV